MWYYNKHYSHILFSFTMVTRKLKQGEGKRQRHSCAVTGHPEFPLWGSIKDYLILYAY